MTKEKVFSVFALGILLGVIFTSLSHSVAPVDAVKKRPSPTPTVAITPTPTAVQNKIAGFYHDLTNAMLNGAFLAYHDFSGFTLTNASLRDTNLTASNFDQANLNGVDFTNANLSNMSHAGATFVDVKWYLCPEGDGMCGETICPDGTTISSQAAVCF